MLLTPTAFVLLAGLEQRVGGGQEVFARLPGKWVPGTALPATRYRRMAMTEWMWESRTS